MKSTLGANQSPGSAGRASGPTGPGIVSHITMAPATSSEPSAASGGWSRRYQFATSAGPSSNGSHGGRPIAGRHSIDLVPERERVAVELEVDAVGERVAEAAQAVGPAARRASPAR